MAPVYQCGRCQRFIEPRGGAAPRFCPLCGYRLGGAPAAGAYVRPRVGGEVPGQAIAALVLGILSLFIPMAGVLLGLLAVGLGSSARKRIRASGYPHTGSGLATAGITLGTLGAILWLLVCLGAL